MARGRPASKSGCRPARTMPPDQWEARYGARLIDGDRERLAEAKAA